MALRFNPPPNWPQPPAGWVPPAGWRPDPSWPALPFGWQLRIDDAEQNRQAVAPYGSQPPTVFPPAAPPSPGKSQPKVTRAQGGPKARRSWQASLARLFVVVAFFFLGLFGAGIATGQIDTAPDTLVASGAFIVIPAVLAVVFFALAARASKHRAAGLVAHLNP
jgi:hypothetical protein